MKSYKFIYLQFYDHSLEQADVAAPLLCEVVGVLYKESELCYFVVPWVTKGDLEDENNECYSILKSTVTRKRWLK